MFDLKKFHRGDVVKVTLSKDCKFVAVISSVTKKGVYILSGTSSSRYDPTESIELELIYSKGQVNTKKCHRMAEYIEMANDHVRKYYLNLHLVIFENTYRDIAKYLRIPFPDRVVKAILECIIPPVE